MPLDNDAQVNAAQPDHVPANSSSVASVVTTDQADWSVTIADTPDPVIAGDPIIYQIAVTNRGDAVASDVSLLDNLPPGLTFRSATPTQGSCTNVGHQLSCNLGTLVKNQAAPVLVEADVSPGARGTLTNTATASATRPAPDSSNNSATATTAVQTNVDVGIAQIVAPEPAIAGASFTYQLIVSNTGRSDATNVIVTNTLPAQARSVNFITPSQGTCSVVAGVVSCNLGALHPATSATVVIQVTVDSSALSLLINIATVVSAEADVSAANNTTVRLSGMSTRTDLAVSTVDIPDPVVANELLAYQVTVRNLGPSDATSVVLTDTLPAGLTVLQLSCTFHVIWRGKATLLTTCYAKHTIQP